MKTKIIDIDRRVRSLRILSFVCLLFLLLTACSSSVPTTQAPEPQVQSKEGSHPPIIQRVVEGEEVAAGYLRHYQDIYFTDPDGDVVAITYRLTSTSLPYLPGFTDDPIEASAAEQKAEALYTVSIPCWQKVDLSFESQIRDQAGNLSDPVPFTMSCTAPQPLDTRSFIVSALSIFLPIALILLLAFWLLFRKRPTERLPALRSTILVFFVFMIIHFLQMVLHEGGHSLYSLAHSVPTTLYVHPFIFTGYSRPIIIGSSVWYDILGSATAIPVGLLISVLFWKRRSPAFLPWVMLFPYIAMGDGFNIMGFIGDFLNVVQSTGLPAVLFFIPGALLACTGIISLFSLLPLAGLDPHDKKALFVLPAGIFLISALSIIVAYFFVPGSSIHLEYFMGQDILFSARSFGILWIVIGIVLAVLYITLFRKLYPRLPAWLQSTTVKLTWKDLLIPGILWAISVIIGLIIVI